MRCYLAGPMTGIPKFNFPMFAAVAAELRAQGWEIVSPAEMDGPEIEKIAVASKNGQLDANGKIAGQTWGDLLARDVKIVADEVKGVIVLPGWEKSRGARLEVFVAYLCNHALWVYERGGVRTMQHSELVNGGVEP